MKLPEWLHPAYSRVEAFEHQGRMPHALLLCGPLGMGLEYLADAIALSALGEATANFPELRLPALAHADLRLVEPEAGKASLSVETIREIDHWLHLTPQLVGGKVVVLQSAHQMSRAAGNALLKTLEEPPLGSLLILVTHAPARLLPTIRSRAQRIDVSRPSTDEAVAWIASRHEGASERQIRAHLFETGGAPLWADRVMFKGRALLGPMLADALGQSGNSQLVNALGDMEVDLWLGIWMRYCALAISPCRGDLVADFPDDLEFEAVWRFWTRLVEARRMLHEGIALNVKLTAENLANAWSKLR